MPGYWALVNRHCDSMSIGKCWRVLRDTKTGVRAVDMHGLHHGHTPALLTRRGYRIDKVTGEHAARLDSAYGEWLRDYVGKVWGTRSA